MLPSATRALALCILVAIASAPLANALVPVTLTLQGPTYVLAGSTAVFTGNHRVDTLGASIVGVPASRVVLYVDGAPVGAGNTGLPSGAYTIPFTFPARGERLVQAVADEDGPSEARSRVASVLVAMAPSAPRTPSAGIVLDTAAIRVSWEAPLDDGGAPIASYLVYRSSGSGWVLAGSAPASVRSFVDTGVDLSYSYQHRVVATNPVAQSPPSEAVSVALGAAPPPPTLTVTPIDASFLVRVAVAKTGDPTQGFLVERQLSNGVWIPLGAPSGSAATFNADVGFPVEPGMPFRATARSFTGTSAPTVVTATGALPGAPSAFSVSLPGNAKFEWDAPTGGGALQGYALFDNGAPLLWWHGGDVELPYWYGEHEKESLAAGTHTFTVAGVNAVGVGPHSAPVTITLAPASAPVGLGATVTEGNRNATIRLDWSAPADSGGAPVLGYTILRTSPPAPAINLPASARTHSFVVAPDTMHAYEVYARTLVGNGVSASTSATVADFDLVLTHSFSHFRVCEGSTCTNVPSGGSYDRAGSGTVTYGPVYTGTLTKRGDPVQGEPIRGWVTQDHDGETTSSVEGVTNAAGAYTITAWPASWTPSGPACRTTPFDFSWDVYYTTPVTTNSITVCP